jgi:hypothetical protein
MCYVHVIDCESTPAASSTFGNKNKHIFVVETYMFRTIPPEIIDFCRRKVTGPAGHQAIKHARHGAQTLNNTFREVETATTHSPKNFSRNLSFGKGKEEDCPLLLVFVLQDGMTFCIAMFGCQYI